MSWTPEEAAAFAACKRHELCRRLGRGNDMKGLCCGRRTWEAPLRMSLTSRSSPSGSTRTDDAALPPSIHTQLVTE